MLFIPESFKIVISNYSFQFPGFGTTTSSKGTNFTITLSNGKRPNPNFLMTYNSTITPDFIFIEMIVVSKKFSQHFIAKCILYTFTTVAIDKKQAPKYV
jgi:hypothetical protein